MATIDVPYLKLRDGRPRWEPGPGLRTLGFKGRDLRDEAGAWLSIEAAIAAARALNAEVDAFRAAGGRRYRAPAVQTRHSCRRCWDDFTKSLWARKLARRTLAQYRNNIAMWLDDGFGDEDVAAVTRPQLIAFYQREAAARGHGMANAIMAVVSVLFSHAERIGWRAENSNPAFRMARPSLAPRCVLWTPREVERLVATADRIGKHSVGDAVVIALHTAQRAGDVLAMTEPVVQGGRARFDLTQRKRKARVSVPVTDQLRDRIDAIRRRRQSGAVAELRLAGPLVRREDGVAYTDIDHSAFAREFREVRRHAAMATAEQQAAPQMLEKQFLDLRDTAITRLALAGCTLAEIRAISGHSLKTITSVLAHYLVLDEDMADAAIDKLKAWISAEGIAL